LLRKENDPGVRNTATMHTGKIAITRHDYAALSERKGKVLRVSGVMHACVVSGYHVGSAAAQGFDGGAGDVRFRVEADFLSHRMILFPL
jgi:hypothetical protein